MTTFKLPDLGEGLAEAEIVRWHVRVGERVEVDQPMVAVETAKAVVEVPSPHSGRIKALHGGPGDVIATGAPLVEFELDAPLEPTRQPRAEKLDPRVPDDSGTVVGSMPATHDEEYVEHAVTSGRSIDERSAARDRVRAAPAVRALAKRLGVDLTRIDGSGRGGLITVDDVMNAAGSGAAPERDAAASTGGTRSAPGPGAFARAASVTAQPAAARTEAAGEPQQLRGLRRAMAQSMSLARDQVASCTIFDDADLHRWEEGNDYTTRLLRAIAAGCKAVPALNAWYDGESQTRRIMDRIDIGVAVDTPDGLLVPVIRDVGNRSREALRQEVDRLKRAALDRTIAPEELRDFTFMLSNFGMIAGRYATPVVVPPAVAILGAGRLSHDVVAVMGGIEAHLRMPLSLTFDHRCITGGEAARFLAALMQDLQRGN